jgi:hypothetical protein
VLGHPVWGNSFWQSWKTNTVIHHF